MSTWDSEFLLKLSLAATHTFMRALELSRASSWPSSSSFWSLSWSRYFSRGGGRPTRNTRLSRTNPPRNSWSQSGLQVWWLVRPLPLAGRVQVIHQSEIKHSIFGGVSTFPSLFYQFDWLNLSQMLDSEINFGHHLHSIRLTLWVERIPAWLRNEHFIFTTGR